MRKAKIGLLGLVMAVATAIPAFAGSTTTQKEDILGQGGTTPVMAHNGARLVRADERVDVSFRLQTPHARTYAYPTADMVPPGAFHPPVVPGDGVTPEVFTLWAFVFNYPELCSDGACSFDDIGDTPAQGGIYQLDGTIARSPHLRLDGKIRIGQQPAVGVALENPFGMEIHAAVAPHGQRYTGDDLVAQMNGSVGTPEHWWPAIFLP